MSDDSEILSGYDAAEGLFPSGVPSGVLGVMLHPWRTLTGIERMAGDLGHIPPLRDRLREAELLLDAQRCENSALLARNADLARRLKIASDSLSDTRARLSEALERIEEYRELDEALRLFSEQLSQAETMKRNYEQRIRTLRAQLRDTRDALRTVTGIDCSDDLQIIDMEAPPPSPSSPPSSSFAPPSSPSSRSSCEPGPRPADLPAAPSAPAVRQRRLSRKPSPYLPPLSERMRKDDSDWLVGLPEDL